MTPEQIAALERKTEGWISGLQLAALSMRDRDDADRFVRSFAGSNRFILDYLIEEVFRQQPPEVQDFLLQTAVLEQLTAPLCDAVIDRGKRRHPTLRPYWSGWNRPIFSSFLWMIHGNGSATITFLPIYCASACGRKREIRPYYTSGPPSGMKSTDSPTEPLIIISLPLHGIRPLPSFSCRVNGCRSAVKTQLSCSGCRHCLIP